MVRDGILKSKPENKDFLSTFIQFLFEINLIKHYKTLIKFFSLFFLFYSLDFENNLLTNKQKIFLKD